MNNVSLFGRVFALVGLVCVGTAFSAACSSSTSESSAQAACIRVQQVNIEHRERCAGSSLSADAKRHFLSRGEAACAQLLALPGQQLTEAILERCATAT